MSSKLDFLTISINKNRKYVKQNKNLYVNVGSIQNLEDYKNFKKYNNKKEALKEHDKKIQ